MSSEFKTLANILRRMGDAMGIVDRTGLSRRVSTNEWTPTINLDVGMSTYTPVYCSNDVTLAAAESLINFVVVTPGVLVSQPATLTSQFPSSAEVETLITGFMLSVEVSGLSGTENTKHVDASRLLGTSLSIPVGVTTSLFKRWGYFDYANSKFNVSYTMGPAQQRSDGTVLSSISSEKPIWVPAGGSFAIRFELDPDANFSIGCRIIAQAVGVQWPRGMKGPL